VPDSAYLSIGSNMGEAIENCKESIRRLESIEGISLKKVSSFYKTSPLGDINQNWFVNCAVCLKTDFTAEVLLQTCLAIETSMGRVRKKRWGERVIDIDLILYGDQIIENEFIHLPHPRMLERGFVLIPMTEIAPEKNHPLSNRPMHTYLPKISDQQVFLYSE
jgi:2-amino-4-hydroxy-6-hydroxymethyldihydropteridine diphosphokinase